MGFIVGGSFVAAFQIPLPPSAHQARAQHTADTETNAEKTNDSILSRLWHWTSGDALSFYTGLLALFTAIVGGSTIGLWIATNRNAKIAERALTEHERPWLFLESASVRMSDPRTAAVIQNNWFIKLHFKNVGRSPAIVTDCLFKIAEMDTLPTDPDYTGANQLGIQRTVSVGEIVETTEVGPGPTPRNRQGAEPGCGQRIDDLEMLRRYFRRSSGGSSSSCLASAARHSPRNPKMLAKLDVEQQTPTPHVLRRHARTKPHASSPFLGVPAVTRRFGATSGSQADVG
jgi:hypothetical protein